MASFSDYIVIYCIYLYYIIKYALFNDSWIPDLQFMYSTILVVLLSIINYASDRISEEYIRRCKFFAHTMFVSIIVSFIFNILSFVYNTIFYYGFINTISTLIVGSMIFLSGVTNIFKDYINEKVRKNNMGNKILNILNYYYNGYYLSKNFGLYISNKLKYLFDVHVYKYIVKIYLQLKNINSVLIDNEQSSNVVSKMYTGYSNSTSYIGKKVFERVFIKQMNQSIFNSNMDMTNMMNDALQANTLDKKYYKNTLSYSNMNMNTIDIANTSDDDLLDDLTDLDLSDAPVVNNSEFDTTNVEPEQNSQISETKHTPNTDTDTSLNKFRPQQSSNNSTPNDNKINTRMALKKKIAEKRSNRTSGLNNNKMMTNDTQKIANMMNTPNMNKLMESMMQGNNLEKILKRMPKDKMNIDMQNINTQQLKEFMKTMSKNSQ